MTYSPHPITDKEAGQFGPLPKEGCYRKVKLPSGRQAVLIRQPLDPATGQRPWVLIPEKDLEQPVRLPPAVVKGSK